MKKLQWGQLFGMVFMSPVRATWRVSYSKGTDYIAPYCYMNSAFSCFPANFTEFFLFLSSGALKVESWKISV